MIRKLIVAVLASCAALGQCLLAQNVDKRAYALYDSRGKEMTYAQLVDSLKVPEVVFIGEIHNCCIAHWLELQLVQSLYETHGEGLTLGAEMLEADNQLILDEYLRSDITQERFEAEARLWPNYSTDYYPIVFFAKENRIPVVATNVPRRYANVVKHKGLSYLDSLTAEARHYLPPLPIRYEEEQADHEMFSMMQMMGGKSGATQHLAQAQALKDATMGWRIAKTLRQRYVHLNGAYHTEQHGGIIPYLLEYRPGTTVRTVVTVRQDDIDRLDPENKGRADFYICVPTDMTMTY